MIELPTARSRTRLLSIASYQWSVKPVIGRPGVAPSSNENTIMNRIGRYRNTISAPNTSRSPQRTVRP